MEIVIGNMYKVHFDAAYRLVEHLRTVSGGAVFSCEERNGTKWIVHAGNRYRFDADDAGSARFESETGGENKEEELGFRYDGATWFRNLREGTASADAEWQSLLEAVSTAYHKQFSILEYTQKPRDRAEDERQANRAAHALAPLFGYTEEHVDVVPVEDDLSHVGSSINIYGLTLRILLGDDEPIRAICRIFFRERKSGEFEAMDMRDALGINEMLVSVGNDGEDDVPEEDPALRNNVLDALQRFLADPASEQKFSRCIFFDDKSGDEDKIDKLARLYRTDGYDLVCREVKVLGIAHLKWECALFDVGYGHGRVLRLSFGLNNGFTVYCINCGDEEPLIENGAIRYTDEENEERVAVLDLDSTEGIMGLDEETVAKIKKTSELHRHLHAVDCGCAPYNRECANRCHCDSQLFTALGAECEHLYCKNCPHPEVVFLDPDSGERRATAGLVYFSDEMTMKPKEAGRACRCCGRFFTTIPDGECYCPTCMEAHAAAEGELSEESAERAQGMYRRYSRAVPLGRRMLGAFSKKYCFEDDGILLFALGKKLYLFDKLLISERGYLKPARPVE